MNAIASGRPREIPGDAGWPLIGQSLDYLFRLDRAVHERYRRYGEVSWGQAFGTRSIILLGPDANQFVLQNRGELFANAAWEHFIARFFHRGLMLLDFDEHRWHRRLMQGAFQREALAAYLERMNPRIEQTLASWPLGVRLRMFEQLKALTLDLGAEAFAGQPPGAQAQRLNRAFLATVRAATGLIRADWPLTRWRRGLLGRRVLEDFFRAELPRKRADGGGDLFARLCQARSEDGAAFSDEDIVNHMIFVLMAAHDTSTITLTNMIYWLGKCPEWQERLRAASRALGRQALSLDDLPRLEAMTWVMKEALRLCAPVPGLPRRAVRDCEYKGFRIPAGHMVQISVWFTHTTPEWWSAPQRFDPERFAEPRAEDRRHPFLWIPFGGGAHKCLGLHFGEMEVKAILHQMLLRFRWRLPEDYLMRQDFTSLPIPRDRLPLRLERL